MRQLHEVYSFLGTPQSAAYQQVCWKLVMIQSVTAYFNFCRMGSTVSWRRFFQLFVVIVASCFR
jgi:hypothetical protein